MRNLFEPDIPLPGNSGQETEKDRDTVILFPLAACLPKIPVKDLADTRLLQCYKRFTYIGACVRSEFMVNSYPHFAGIVI